MKMKMMKSKFDADDLFGVFEQCHVQHLGTLN